MWSDTLQGVRERRARRWFLILPVALGGAVTLPLLAMPVLLAAGLFFVISIFWYTLIALAAATAPGGRRTIALLLAALAVAYCVWLGRLPPDPDPDDISNRAFIVAVLLGSAIPLVLVLFRVQPSWLLVVPAYFLGVDLLLPPVLLLGALAGAVPSPDTWPFEIIYGGGMVIAICLPAILGTYFAARTAPSHRRWVTVGAVTLTLVLIVAAYYNPGL
jgi:hypothetical protein